jgi:hypothetical protein
VLSLQKQNRRLDDFATAEKLQRLLRAIDRKLQITAARRQERDTQKVRFAEVRAIVGAVLDEWNASFDEFLRATELEMARMAAAQSAELCAFDASAPAELTPQYRRQSPALLEARTRERALALNERFCAAQRMKERNDAQADREMCAQFERMREDWGRKRQRIVEKHEEQMRVFVDHVESNRARMIRERNGNIEGHVRRMGKINAEFEGGEALTGELSEERRRAITEIEDAYPIPRMRGSAFAEVRRRLRKKKKAEKVETMTQTVVGEEEITFE